MSHFVQSKGTWGNFNFRDFLSIIPLWQLRDLGHKTPKSCEYTMKFDYSPVAYTGQFWIQGNRSPACTHCALHWVNRSTRWTFFPSLLHRSLFTLATAEQIFKKWNKSIFASDTESVKSGRCYTSILIYSITIIQQRVCKISFAAKKRFVQQIILNRQNYDKDNVNGQRFIKRTQCNAVFSKF